MIEYLQIETPGDSERCAWFGGNEARRPPGVIMHKAKNRPARSAGVVMRDGTPFFFKRRIELRGSEPDYVRKCLADARKHLLEEQRRHYGFDMIWDLRNGLTLYVVVLHEILASRAIRYFAPLKPSVCMAAYLGHSWMLDILRRSGVPVETMVWDTLNVLTSAILGRHLALVKKLMVRSSELRNSINPWYGDVASFCAGFGSVGILRNLRSEGFDLRKLHRHPKQHSDDVRQCGSALLFAGWIGISFNPCLTRYARHCKKLVVK